MNIRVVCLAVVMAFVTVPVCAQSLSAAKSRVAQANEAINAERFDDIDGLLTAAEKFLVGLPDAEKAPVLADQAYGDSAALRTCLDAMECQYVLSVGPTTGLFPAETVFSVPKRRAKGAPAERASPRQGA